MKISYDKEADALNIVLKTGSVDRTIELSSEIFLDLDKKGNPLYLEILGASERVGKKNFGKITIGSKLIGLPAFT